MTRRLLKDMTQGEMDRSVARYRDRQDARYEFEMDRAQDRRDQELAWLEEIAPELDGAA